MAFSRSTALGDRPDTLTRDRSTPFEETLVYASAVGMDDHDLRVLAVLTTWLSVHHAHMNVSLNARGRIRI